MFCFCFVEPPSAPGKPEPLEVASDSLTIFWKAPEDDGNDDIIEYILEYKEKVSVKWIQITDIKETSYKVTELNTDSEYMFRVVAKNNIGASPPSPISDFIRVTSPFEKEPPTIIEPLVDKFVGLNEKLTLTTVIGGSPVPTVTWYKNEKIIEEEHTTYENRITKYIIEETTIETEAIYKCVAVNEQGSTETSCKVIVQEKPQITVADKQINQKLRTGKTYKIEANVSGFPEPEITLSKNGSPMPFDNKRITIRRETNIVIIEITTIDRDDSGKYTIIAKNNAGEASVDLTLKVIDKPDRPSTLNVKNIQKDSVTIAWTPPIDDGGLDITKYLIEKRDPDKLVWIKVADVDKSISSYCVQKLIPNAAYIFRVVAENPVGVSEPQESDAITIKVKIGK